jgi:hydrogenase expression/formation protein HypE
MSRREPPSLSDTPLPVGKLPPKLLAELLAAAPARDPSVLVGPGIGMDCAVVEFGERLLVCKSDPVTFVTDHLGDYLVRVNANDVATTGATPRWLLVTLLLPEASTTEVLVRAIMAQIGEACREMGITLIGGHTEITHGLDRPVAVGALLGEVARDRLITPRGARPGDRILLTKGVPIEGTAILAQEFSERLRPLLGEAGLQEAQAFLRHPGISVVPDARLAMAAGEVSAMHDPTEGGLATALWELAEASGRGLLVDLAAVPVPEVSARICDALGIDPVATIASGALLLTAPAADSAGIIAALAAEGIPCAEIGEVHAGPPTVEQRTAGGAMPLACPERDELARLFEGSA